MTRHDVLKVFKKTIEKKYEIPPFTNTFKFRFKRTKMEMNLLLLWCNRKLFY